MDIAAILRSNQTNTFVNTKGKVSRIEDCQLVGTPPDRKFRRQVYLTDATGSLVIVFWRQQASTLIFEEGDVLSVKNLRISTWNGKVTGNVTVETELTIIDEEIKVTQAVLPKPSNIVSTTPQILAIKDFIVTSKCRNCSATQPINTASKLYKCSQCTAISMKGSGVKKDLRCNVLISDPKEQWYTAFTQV